MAIVMEEDYLAHYGILRRSGRYPWGSGGTQSSRNRRFLDEINRLKKEEGLTDTEIARGFGISTTTLRAAKSIAVNEQRQQKINMAQRLQDKGYSAGAIGERMDLNESSVRSLLAAGAKDKVDVLDATSNMLKEQVSKKEFIDVGTGVERHLGISSTKLSTALAVLKEEGYEVHTVKVQQLGTGEQTTLKVLAKPGATQKQVWENRNNIKGIGEFSQDGGRSFLGIKPPIQVSSKRIAVKYAEDGGAQADGVIFVRPGAKDLSLGRGSYAQVRIAVDGTHYLKGMALYKEGLPPGTDLVFNTSKNKGGSKLDAMKPLKDDPDNPFGSTVRQILDQHGNVKSAMNIVGSKEGAGEEGSWGSWKKSLSSQLLTKQSPDLAKKQLAMTAEHKRLQFEEIKKLTNPTVRRLLLDKLADSADSSAVQLEAWHLPRQASRVILPLETVKPHEIYAPAFHNGERVALVRYPHGGPFEIPELTVNNKNPEGKKLLGNSVELDAIGIHHTVAEHLSGADFDGDTVLVIPNGRGTIKTAPPLQGLKGFDPKRSYPPYEGMRTVDGGVWRGGKIDYEGRKPSSSRKGYLMGDVSNLITDMTIRGASTTERAAAVRHSMVVIDSEKHSLDHKSSARDNGIPALKAKYQGVPTGSKTPSRAGASTIISRASSPQRVPHRVPRAAADGGPIDKATGKKVFVETGRGFTTKDGVRVTKTTKVKALALTDDAHTLSSGTPVEKIYADHSNKLKALANEARKEMVNTTPNRVQPSAKVVYKPEVESLNAKLNLALRNAPLERQAQVIAGSWVATKRQANPNMDSDEVKKIKFQALKEARLRTGAQKHVIDLTQKEWDAIQAGAIAPSTLDKLLNHADLDRVRELATPRTHILMTSSKSARAKGMLAQGFTQAEVASALGVSLTTLKTSLSG